jgi:putative transferase (TIGR04331 family)
MPRYLITTADERSWDFERSVLFLGEECRRYDRKHVWSEMDAVVLDPIKKNSEEKLLEIEYIQLLVRQILTELTEILNSFHGTAHSERYWNIILGHWLQRYVAVIYNRYYIIDNAFINHSINGSSILEVTDYSLATTDSLSFIFACTNDLWNHVLFTRIMRYRDDLELELSSFRLDGEKRFSSRKQNPNWQQSRIKRFIHGFISKILPRLSKDTDAVIINSYLPRKAEIKLQFALGQVPQLWRLCYSSFIDQSAPNVELRDKIKFSYNKYDGFERYVRWQLPQIIPTCFLEGYKNLLRRTERLPFPAKPLFIFTSNNFDTDEIFKTWTAGQVEKGTPYFVGQHGNNYGTHKYYANKHWPEQATVDRFFTWGWKDVSRKYVPAFMLKGAEVKPKSYNPEGGVLLIEFPPPHRNALNDNHHEYSLFQEEQFRFAENLPTHIHKVLTVRLHRVSKRLPWFTEQRWKDRSPKTNVEAGEIQIKKLIAKNRLIVHSYDSTGILETLALNIPTICFWRGNLDHLLPSAKPYYELLVGVGIIVQTPEEAASRVASHWDDIKGWWETSDVQNARKVFIDQYARIEDKPVQVLKKLLIQYAKRK